MAYQYKEFPRVLHQTDGRTLTVGNEDDKAVALAEGWSLTPFVDGTGNRFDVVPEAPVADDAPKAKKKKAQA